MLKKTKNKKTGAHIILDNLVQNGIDYIFGYPGGAILPLYDELYFWEEQKLIKHILARHEQGAIHAADGYARSSKKIGLCFATSGPGVTNLITGIATAQMDSIPLVVVSGQVAKNFIGTDAFQEVNTFDISLSIVKHSYLIQNINSLPEILFESFFLVKNGRPGVILIDLPKNIGLDKVKFISSKNQFSIEKKKNYKEPYYVKSKIFFTYLINFKKSYQPLLYVGGGIIRSNCFKLLQEVIKLFQIPLTTTLMGLGSFNKKNCLSLGMLGMHGTAYANFAVSECDFLIALGVRFDDRVTGKLEEFACNAKVLHLDIDSNEISKNRPPHLGTIGDIKKILDQFLKYYRKKTKHLIKLQNWQKSLKNWKISYPLNIDRQLREIVKAQRILFFISTFTKTIYVTTDVGQHQMWAAQLLNCRPQKWISSSGLGTMGYGLPAAIGANFANPFQNILCITGDSSIQMNFQELGTLSQYSLNIKILIINNNWQGMVRQWQESFYNYRFSNSYMQQGMPNYILLAEAFTIKGKVVKRQKIFEKALLLSLKKKKAFLFNLKVTKNENCYPMIIPGRSNDQMLGF